MRCVFLNAYARGCVCACMLCEQARKIPEKAIDTMSTNAEDAVMVLCDIDRVAKELREEAAARKETVAGELSVEETLKLVPTRELIIELAICAALSYVRVEEEGTQSADCLDNCIEAAKQYGGLLKSTGAAAEFKTRSETIVEEAKNQKKSLVKTKSGVQVMKSPNAGRSMSAFEKILSNSSAEFVSEKLRDYLRTSLQVMGASFLHRVMIELQQKVYPSFITNAAEEGEGTEVEDDARPPPMESVPMPEEAANLRKSRRNLKELTRAVQDPLEASLVIASSAAAPPPPAAATPSKRRRRGSGSTPAAADGGGDAPAAAVDTIPSSIPSSEGLETGSPILVIAAGMKSGIAVGGGEKLPRTLDAAGQDDMAAGAVWANPGRSPFKGRPKGRAGKMWTPEEEAALIEATEKAVAMESAEPMKRPSGGRSGMPWKKIVALAGDRLDGRTDADCKDKVRFMRCFSCMQRNSVSEETHCIGMNV